jgi:hypothetical protein
VDIRKVILATLSGAALSTAACGESSPETGSSDDSFCSGSEPFDHQDGEVWHEEVEMLLAQHELTHPNELECRSICSLGFFGAQIQHLDSCEVTWVEGYLENYGGTMGDGTGEETGMGDELVATVSCSGVRDPICLGRRPRGHRRGRVCGSDELGRSLARFADLEAASRRHARLMGALAGAHGGVTQSREPDRGEVSLFEAAMHNAVEGCVKETWAALLGHVWAERADDESLRLAFASITADEIRHGQLAWDLHEWFQSQLEPDEAAQVDRARASALESLPELAREEACVLPEALGSLGPREAAGLAARFATRLAA